MHTRFLIFTDLHVDIMHDAVARMQLICAAAQQEKVDFLLHLGDIMYPDVDFLQVHAAQSIQKRQQAWFINERDDEKHAILQMLHDTGLPLYGVLGNHDMDACDKATACKYWNMPAPYYAFVQGGVRFFVLDGNYIQTNDGLIDFEHCNYSQFKRSQTSFLPKEQLQWLKKSTLTSKEPCVFLSHAPLGDELLNIHNMQEVWAIIDEANAEKRKVLLAINGHNHMDGLSVRHGVPFVSINSAANLWLGHEYSAVRYSETICRMYPHLSSCAPYFDPLYAIITIDERGIHMQGTQSRFVGKSPQELGFPKDASYFEPCACIRSRELPLTAMSGAGKV